MEITVPTMETRGLITEESLSSTEGITADTSEATISPAPVSDEAALEAEVISMVRAEAFMEGEDSAAEEGGMEAAAVMAAEADTDSLFAWNGNHSSVTYLRSDDFLRRVFGRLF